jgi:hypothetical protein
MHKLPIGKKVSMAFTYMVAHSGEEIPKKLRQ